MSEKRSKIQEQLAFSFARRSEAPSSEGGRDRSAQGEERNRRPGWKSSSDGGSM